MSIWGQLLREFSVLIRVLEGRACVLSGNDGVDVAIDESAAFISPEGRHSTGRSSKVGLSDRGANQEP